MNELDIFSDKDLSHKTKLELTKIVLQLQDMIVAKNRELREYRQNGAVTTHVQADKNKMSSQPDEAIALKSEAKSLQDQLQTANVLADKLRTDKGNLEAKIKAMDLQVAKLEGSLDQTTNAHIKLKEGTDYKLQQLQKTIDELNQKVEIYEREYSMSFANNTNVESTLANVVVDSKSRFIIDIYPYQEDFHGKITHPLSSDKIELNGLDAEAILNFISSHLPAAFENGSLDKSTKVNRNAGKISPPVEKSTPPGAAEEYAFVREFPGNILSTIKLAQKTKGRTPENYFCSQEPIDVQLTCRLPENYNGGQFYNKSFSFQFSAKDQITGGHVFDNNSTEELKLGVIDYAARFTIPKIPKGGYFFDAFLHIPGLNISENKRLYVEVN